MKKYILILMSVLILFVLSGCFEKNITTSGETILNDSGEIKEPINIEENYDEALSKIREALKDEEFVNKNLRLQKTCFGEDIVTSGDQELTFAKFGKDKAIVRVYAYDSDNFGTAVTLVYYEDGEVKTLGNPSVNEPYHPGHGGFSFDFENEAMIAHYMHMGYYEEAVYKFENNDFNLIANYDWAEMDESGNFIESESGDPLADYTFTKGDEITRGRASFVEIENMIAEDLKDYEFGIMDTILTPENVDLYIK